MKTFKKLLYIILIGIMMLCGLIVVCAMNPELTEKIAEGLYGKGAPLESVADGNFRLDFPQLPISGVLEEMPEVYTEVVIPDIDVQFGTDEGIDIKKASISSKQGYTLPENGFLSIPKATEGKSDYVPIQDEKKEVEEAEAELLKNELQIGETGEELKFSTEIYPYYGLLTEDSQTLYRQIYANAVKCNANFAPAVPVTITQLKNVFEALYNDQPGLFWLDTGYSCKYEKGGSCVEITLKYNETVSRLEEEKKRFEQAVEGVLNDARKLMDDTEIMQSIHDTLIQNVIYDKNAPMNQSAYSALVNGESVCAGYARAYQYLLQKENIPCYYCTGFSGENHAWNIVKIGNRFTNVDTTWDDTDPATYDYFNRSDAEFQSTHVRKGLSVYLPACEGPALYEEPLVLEKPEDTEIVKPLEYENAAITTENKNLEEANLKAEEVLPDLEAYQADCLAQLLKVGSGKKQFQNVISASLWDEVERYYSSGAYEKDYVKKALEEMGKENFAIQLQGVRLGGGYLRLYHNVSTW